MDINTESRNIYDDLKSRGVRIYSLTEMKHEANRLFRLQNKLGLERIVAFGEVYNRVLRGGVLPVQDVFPDWDELASLDDKKDVFNYKGKEIERISIDNFRSRIGVVENGVVKVIAKRNKVLAAQISSGNVYTRILEYLE